MIPICKPDVTAADIGKIAECAASGWVSRLSPFVADFEKAFADYVGASYGVAVNSGGSGLDLALAALKIGRGDEVVVPDFTMVASANAVVHVGATPVFVDADDSWCMNPDKITVAVTPRTKAVMPVHIYGHPCNMTEICRIARENGLFVIEDAAEAIGSTWLGYHVGKLGDIGCFSLYANKTITAGEGGVNVTNRKDLMERMTWLRSHCFGKGRHFWHEEVGFSFCLSGLHAALGLSQLNRVREYVEARREHAKLYMKLLKPLEAKDKIVFPPEKTGAKNSYWMFTILINDFNRDKLIEELEKKGIETRPTFTPMHQLPPYRGWHGKIYYKVPNDFPVSDVLGKKGINLPSSNGLTEEEIRYVCDCVTEILK